MNQVFDKPQLIFFSLIPIIILSGLLSGGSALDLNIHNTYFVISYFHLAVLISILFGLFGLGYWFVDLANFKLNKRLNIAHIISMFGSLVIGYRIAFSKRDSTEFALLGDTLKLELAQTFSVFLVFLGLVLFLINITTSMTKRNKIHG
jgi:cytochrome c oxidase subunit 1